MEDSWIYDYHEDDSSYCSLTDSDKIDSETEAELYSKIHHESNIFCMGSKNLNEDTSGLLVCMPSKKDVLCIDERKNTTNEHAYFNQISYNFSNDKRKSSEMDECCNNELNSVKKHKLNSACQSVDLNSNDLEGINGSFQFKVNNTKKKNTVSDSNYTDKSNKTNDTIMLHSSDSDSDIWIEPTSTEKNDLKINLLKDTDTIFLSSSDSDNELDVSSTSGERDSILRNLSMPNMKTEGNSKGLWQINFEDLYRSKKYSRRYHENFDVTCSNCNRKGHTSRTCPSPRVIKCFVCGGNHMGFRCSNRMCSNCHASGHDRKNCWREVKKGYCHLCNMAGHARTNCPDLWRRYHLTTSPFKIKKGKEVKQYSKYKFTSTNLYCWNCGENGHFGAICPLSHPSNSNFYTWPCVISYDNPKGIFKNRVSVLKKHPSLNLGNLDNISRASSENKDSNFKSKNESSISNTSNVENSGNKDGKNKFRTDQRFKKVQNTMKEKNFPRTPKKSPKKGSSNFVESEEHVESPKTLIKKQLNKMKRQWNKKVKRTGFPFESLEKDQDDISGISNEKYPISSEDNLPASLKFQIENKFKKWKKNRMRRLRKIKQNALESRFCNL